MATPKRRSTYPRLPVDKLGVLVLLRNMLHLVPGLSDDNRALLTRFAELATLDLHPRPLPAWLWSYQLMSEARRRRVDAFVTRQATLDESERKRMEARSRHDASG
jgi:hypothetical protein